MRAIQEYSGSAKRIVDIYTEDYRGQRWFLVTMVVAKVVEISASERNFNPDQLMSALLSPSVDLCRPDGFQRRSSRSVV
jgi:hypothetical protein